MYMLHTSGEMFMSPVGLSQMTKLSPLSIVSFVMAVWYMALAMANLFGGWIAGIASTETIGGQVLDPAAAMAQSLLVFKGYHRPGLDRHRRAVPGPVADPQEVVARLGRHHRALR
jgi:dipeptide/tripeptide permease